MKMTIGLASVLLFAWNAVPQGTLQVVVPGGLANVGGNSSSADLFLNGPARMVQVYSASEFSLAAPAVRIDAISFRLDENTGQSFVGLWPSVAIVLSTTTRSPDSLSPVFDDNAGTDNTFVFGGPLGIVANNAPGVRPFQIRIPFSTPFLYDPSKGNLALDIVTFGSTSVLLDAQLASGDTVGRVYGDGLSGTVDSLGMITRFDLTLVPEPSTLALTVVGAFVLYLFSVNRKKRQLLNERRLGRN